MKDKGVNMASERLLNVPQKSYEYGCVFCQSGKESIIANCIRTRCSQITATAVYQTKRRTLRGITTLHNEVILRGYVLLQVPEGFSVLETLPREEIISVLTYTDGDWRLYGDNEAYAKWIFQNQGLIGLSRAYRVGDRIQIADGPLKDLEGHITRIDRRNKSGQVSITFGGKTIKIWLGFNYIEDRETKGNAFAAGETL